MTSFGSDYDLDTSLRWYDGLGFLSRSPGVILARCTGLSGNIANMARHIERALRRTGRVRCHLLRLLHPTFAAVCATLAMPVTAAEYPSKSIRLIIPSAPGGAPDIFGRLIAIEIGKQMGQQVVVDNRPGASGIIGFEAIAKAAPDGYTLGYQIFSFMTNPSAYVKLPYDTEKDFQPVVRQGANAGLMTVTPSLPVKSVRELIDYARAHPGKLSYGATGATSTNALGMDLFKVATGTQIVQVLYKGIQQAITDTIAGQVHIVCDSMSSIAPHVHAGCLRALGVTTVKRLPIMPDMPTIAEAGLPGFEIAVTNGYLLPARAPRDIVLRLNAEMNKALVSPAVSEKFLANGSLVGGGTPELFADYLRRETVKWAGAIKAAGIKPH